jgi:hypothetical protein
MVMANPTLPDRNNRIVIHEQLQPRCSKQSIEDLVGKVTDADRVFHVVEGIALPSDLLPIARRVLERHRQRQLRHGS